MSETDTTEDTTEDTAEVDESETDYQAEAEKWKALSRKNEERARENAAAARELEELRRTSMSDQERAVEEAKATARAEALSEVAVKMAAIEIKAALTGIVADPSSIVEDLNLSRYVTDDGDVDSKAIKALSEKYAKLSPGTGTADLKQGARTPSSPSADGNEWMRSL